MSEVLLSAILHIFALFTLKLPDGQRAHARERVIHYLGDYLGIRKYEEYLGLYDEFLEFYAGSPESIEFSRAGEIAKGISGKVTRLDQYVLVLRFFEICRGMSSDDLSLVISNVLMDSFQFTPGVREGMLQFGRTESTDRHDHESILLVNFDRDRGGSGPVLNKREFTKQFKVLYIRAENAFFLKSEKQPVQVDGVTVPPGCISLLSMGAIVRDEYRNAIYYNEIAARMLGDRAGGDLLFSGKDLEFRFPGSRNGLHSFTFEETGGTLVGIMGGSGAGKSTLLGILNGSIEPDSGSVRINGIDLYAESGRLDGVIGVVPQDDLLFEELTVFENLYYNARLCMADLSEDKLVEEVQKTLRDLNQYEIRDLKVGSPLEKSISGGQRKRLNIALELIRKPTILFVDEPTSGLSSADSENVMNLLKEQAASGKLVMVVIHQPSSHIFKMFDKLWILDRGGRPIYNGNPVEAITYFRRAVNMAGMDETVCPECGSVNPEQIFELIEMRALDNYGHWTGERRISPQEWHEKYLNEREKRAFAGGATSDTLPAPTRGLKRPSLAGQLLVFFQRIFRARLANRQYLLITLLEPPVLALFIGIICRGFSAGDFAFKENENLGVYLFMCVIVSIFLGLSISAEEINRDRKILQREHFLNLSWFSYINAKVGYLALVTAVQMALFTVIANLVVGLEDFFWPMWLILFSCGMTACLLGLNISASFKTAVTIYILIPILLIPQMMLCGVVIKYDQLIPKNSGNRLTPFYADVIPSRWGYEALIVEQYRNNRYMRHFFDTEKVIRQNGYMVDYHLPEIQSLADYIFLRTELKDKETITRRNLKIMANEVKMLETETGISSGLSPHDFTMASFDRKQLDELKHYLKRLKETYNDEKDEASMDKEEIENGLREKLGPQGLEKLKGEHFNKSIHQLALNEQELESVAVSGDRLVQKVLPIYYEPSTSWGRSHFYAERKRLGNVYLSTFHFNTAVLWILSLLGYLILFFRICPRVTELFEKR
ncbi:MAG: ATP-binding cassette domain-containing protein [Desulfobacteraceae bacterium]|nr:MAG: ATP-binding cassette domain-containing protein [Desulfobacteraceae bacterium]